MPPRSSAVRVLCAVAVLLRLQAANARQLVGDAGIAGEPMMTFVVDVEFGAEPKLVRNVSDPVPDPFPGAQYCGGAVDTQKRMVYGLYASGQVPSTQTVFVAVSVDTGLPVETSPDLHGDIALWDGESPFLTVDEGLGGVIVLSFRRHALAILDVYVIDPATWAVTRAGSFGEPLALPFFLVEDGWAYSDDTHQLTIAAGLPNTTHQFYSGVMIVGSLHQERGRGGSGGGGGNVTMQFATQVFTSELSIMENLGCFTGTGTAAAASWAQAADGKVGGRAPARGGTAVGSAVDTTGTGPRRNGLNGTVLGVLAVIAPELGIVLGRWDLASIDNVTRVGAVTPLNETTMWAASSPCVSEDGLFVIPMDIDSLNNGTRLWMFNTSSGASFRSETQLSFSPANFLTALQ